MPSDVTGLANSLMTFIGAFSISASLGIEASLIGAKLIRISRLTTPIGASLFAVGYILDHKVEIKEYLTEIDYKSLKEQYNTTINKLNEVKNTLTTHLGKPLFDAVTNLNSPNIDKLFAFGKNGKLAYDFDYLDPTGLLNLKEKLDISPSDLYYNLNELNIELNAETLSSPDKNFELASQIESSINPFLTAIEATQPISKEIPQELFLSIDMNNSNLELIHLTKDDLRNSSLYTHITKPPFIHYHNKDLPWLNDSSYFLEVNNKFFHMDHQGINKGMSFPILFDTISKKPIGLPLDIKGDFIEMNTFDVLQNSPQLFDDPGHVYNNMALQRHLFHKTAIQSSIQINHLSNNAIQSRMQELQVIKNKDVLKIKHDEIKGLNENIKQNGQTGTLSPISGNSREGKYCVRSDDSDELDIIDPNGNNQKIVVEVCFDINQFVY